MCLNSNIKVWLRRIAPCLLEWFILDEPSIEIIFVPFSCLLLFLSLLLLILYLQKWRLKVILKTTKYSIKKMHFQTTYYCILERWLCTCSYSSISRHIIFEPVLPVFWKAFENYYWKLAWPCIYLFIAFCDTLR